MEAGLSVLGKDWGMGSLDQKFFQFDETSGDYLAQKELGRDEDVFKYFLSNLREAESEAFLYWFQKRLLAEGVLVGTAQTPLELSFCIPEDFALVRLCDNQAILALASIFFPNHWSPSEKFGKNFLEVHAPIPNMDKINASHIALLKASLKQDQPKVRFAWGIATDSRLNHHPIPPLGISQDVWHGRSPTMDGPLYTRVERQVLAGIPHTDLVYFSIRTYFTDFSEMNHEDLDCIRACILDMDEAILNYKGLFHCKDLILNRLERAIVALS